jgi:hypothetical protein
MTLRVLIRNDFYLIRVKWLGEPNFFGGGPQILYRFPSKDYFFLNPIGHFGFLADTFLVVFPFTQVIVVFLAAAAGEVVALLVGVATGLDTSCFIFTFKIGDENVKLFAVRYIQPSFSLKRVVATWLVPSDETIEIVAETGASVNP